ncbi:MAG: hypothetical protein PVI86_17455, partial [Phycisphaerae bacterium]
NTAGDAGAIAYRFAIPQIYDDGNDVTMRLSFYRIGPWFSGECLVFTLDAYRLRNGEDIMPYGTRLWVRPDVQKVTPDRKSLAEYLLGDGTGEGGIFLVLDIPINSEEGIDDAVPLAPAEMLAFEIATASKPDLTVWDDGGRYELLGVEFFESEPDTAELVGATLFPTAKDIFCGEFIDCNDNGVHDAIDIAQENSEDCNESGVPDECEEDCNENGLHDDCELSGNDCNENGVLDECELDDNDCNDNQIVDECELDGNDCNENRIPDDCELDGNDCNENQIPDECDLGDNDCNQNQVPDDCELTDNDCNESNIPDDCELVENDCNENLIPDECDIGSGQSQDTNQNGIPDECEPESLEGWWEFIFRAESSCEPDLFDEFTLEYRYLRFDEQNQLVENYILVNPPVARGTNGECIHVLYPSTGAPNYIEYRFAGNLVNDTNRTIESESFDTLTGAFSIEELVDVPGRDCFGEEGTTLFDGTVDGDVILGNWEFLMSDGAGLFGECEGGDPPASLCGPLDATRVPGPPDCTIVDGNGTGPE